MAGYAPSDAPLVGEELIGRFKVGAGNAPMNDGQLRLGYFRAHRSESITKAGLACITAAGATPTLARVGIYSVATVGGLPTGDLTLVASTTSDTALLSTAGLVEKSLSATWQKRAGVWYAAGVLVKTAASAPAIAGAALTTSLMLGGNSRPRIAALLSSQTDLPATITAGTLSPTSFVPYILFQQS